MSQVINQNPDTEAIEGVPLPENDRKAYIYAVNCLALESSNFIFANSKKECAAIVLATIFKYATKEVKIFDQSLNGDITTNQPLFFEELKKFIGRGGVLKIILEDGTFYPTQISHELSTYASTRPGSVEIRQADDEFKNNIESIFDKNIYFTVGDRRSFRMKDTLEKTAENRKAICSFDRPKTASKLANEFDKSFGYLKKIELIEFAPSLQ